MNLTIHDIKVTICDTKVTIYDIKVTIYETEDPIYACERLEGPASERIFYISFHLQQFMVVSSNYEHHIHSRE